MLDNIKLVELSTEQKATIENAFKVEHLIDEVAIVKMFDYDFDDLED